MAPREQMVRTAKQWIQAHNERSADGHSFVASLTSTDFVARTFSSSLQAPSKNREEYLAFQARSLTLFDTYRATETDMIVDEAQNKVVYYLNAEGTGLVGEYKNEYIHKLTLMEDGSLIRGFDAFMDSQPLVAWMKKT
ncbi:hypothetical protein M426DRAFT_319259 [Hypoxylon sp. CI-4A]|nr:hypothetical protein M426DRAFT_319259 [Hypoxylon sp. CI-4A]